MILAEDLVRLRLRLSGVFTKVELGEAVLGS